MTWLKDFADVAATTDNFVGQAKHAQLLAAGLVGETGGIVAELKKERRERDAYPAYRHKMLEEIGDALWYFVRLTSVLDPEFVDDLDAQRAVESRPASAEISHFLELAAAVGALADHVREPTTATETRACLRRVWILFAAISDESHVDLAEAAAANLRKVQSRWPTKREFSPLFDDAFPEEEQLPRHLDVEFRERVRGEGQRTVVLRCNRLNFGDRLTDNIDDADGYRFHDVFHFAYAAYLGWSPVVRSLLKCKRKSDPRIDEAQDGARAAIVEEAVSAAAFARGKHLGYFDGLDHVDFDLLKTIGEFVDGYEVERVPLWQWEVAILKGFEVFRQLRTNGGGRVILDLEKRELRYVAAALQASVARS